jgi:hypothetical protein
MKRDILTAATIITSIPVIAVVMGIVCHWYVITEPTITICGKVHNKDHVCNPFSMSNAKYEVFADDEKYAICPSIFHGPLWLSREEMFDMLEIGKTYKVKCRGICFPPIGFFKTIEYIVEPVEEG